MSSINTNISAFYAQNNLRAANEKSQMSIARLSSGNKIVRAADDVAALSVGTILRTDVNTLKTALVNANQGSTLLQIADGALARVGEILQRQKALATQSNSGTLSSTEKGYLQQEFSKLTDELDRIVGKTNFNGIKLLDGTINSAGSMNTDLPTAASGYRAAYTESGSANSTFSNGSSLVHTAGTYDRGFVRASFVNPAAGNEVDALDLMGSLDKAVVSGVSTDATSKVVLTVSVNGETFTSAELDTDTGGAGSVAQSLTFTNTKGTQAFALRFNAFTTTVDDNTKAQDFADDLQAELRKVSIFQIRSMDDAAATGGIKASELANTVLDGMDGTDFKVSGKDFKAVAGDDAEPGRMPSIEGFKVISESSSAASFYIKVNGVEYKNEDVAVDANISNNDLGGGNGIIRMYKNGDSTNNPNDYFEINLSSASGIAGIGITDDDEAASIADAINKALGSSSYGGLDFQVGTSASDAINVNLAGVSSTALYVKTDGTEVDMNLVSGNISDISEALDNAIRTVTSRRADVGALQSRFSYAASSLEVSIQNLDAARGQFLDADISSESTAFATAQVLQQASISVLAQANQIPQNLLKLIG
jgi:flagellin